MIKCQFISAFSKRGENFLANWKMWACLISQFGFIDGFYFRSKMNLIFPKGWKVMYWLSKVEKFEGWGLNLELGCTPPHWAEAEDLSRVKLPIEFTLGIISAAFNLFRGVCREKKSGKSVVFCQTRGGGVSEGKQKTKLQVWKCVFFSELAESF